MRTLLPPLMLFITLGLAGCAAHNLYYDPAKPHHTPEGFRNPHQPPRQLDMAFLKWQWQRVWQGFPPQPPTDPIPTQTPATDYLVHNRSDTTITWIGHATLLLQTGGLNILTDPVFSDRAFPVSFLGPKRHQPPGVPLERLPRIDAVLISHDHYDHLDLHSIRRLYQQAGGPPEIYAPLGINDWLARHVTQGDSRHLHGLDWWDSQRLAGVELQLLPVQHWCARGLLDRNHRLWGAWSVHGPQLRFFFGGDFALSADLDTIGARTGGFDLAALPIGAYEPRWMMKPAHINPAEAVDARSRLHARRAVAMHWGTFELSDEPLEEPPRALARARQAAGLPEDDFFLLRHGETRIKAGDDWQPPTH